MYGVGVKPYHELVVEIGAVRGGRWAARTLMMAADDTDMVMDNMDMVMDMDHRLSGSLCISSCRTYYVSTWWRCLLADSSQH